MASCRTIKVTNPEPLLDTLFKMPATPLLMTPGPLSTAQQTRDAMGRDWGSRDPAFTALTARVRDRLLTLSGAAATHVCVPLQGSGTFIVEAALGTLIPKTGKALVLVNGAYGRRMAHILKTLGRQYAVLDCAEDKPTDTAALDAALGADPALHHVLAVHCETTTGILNPIAAIADITARHGRRLIIDAMSAFGGLAFDGAKVPFDALVASSNKCLEGVPGLGFAIIQRDTLTSAAGNCHSVSLDLCDQWRAFEANGQWRFTPPTHVLAALDAALDALDAEGGIAGRNRRYRANADRLTEGMAALGFEPLLGPEDRSPIIVTFHMPADAAFRFDAFYDALAARGFVIYPGKLAAAPSFRIGCIGQITPDAIGRALEAIGAVLADLGVTSGRPA